MYANGEGVEQDYMEATKWYRKAAEQGHAQAQTNLGVVYANGEGVEQDYMEAVKWYRKAAEQGHALAQTNLGSKYAKGEGVEQDFVEAFNWYCQAADQGLAQAQNNLGWMYQSGRGAPQDYVEAIKWYLKAAEQGHAQAQSNLGEMYQNGEGVEQDYVEAFNWYRQAADQGLAQAQNNLGWMYQNGQGVEQDYVEAGKWTRKAADQGMVEAQYKLGAMYQNGEGVEQDYAGAVKWYRKAADQGLAQAQNNLGLMYKSDRGAPQDYVEAIKWYLKAAEQGHAKAQNNLGSMYTKGRGVEQNFFEAVNWYRKAADQVMTQAQSTLGLIYAMGQVAVGFIGIILLIMIVIIVRENTIRKYFSESWQLTKSHFLAFFFGGFHLVVILGLFLLLSRELWFRSIIPIVVVSLILFLMMLSFLFPTLVTGLEGMYLKAIRGEKVKGTDIYMYLKKCFPLFGAGFCIVMVTSVISGGYSAIGKFLLQYLELILDGYKIIAVSIWALFILGLFVLFALIERQHLHALNLVAESDIKIFAAFRLSKEAIKHRFASAFLVFSYMYAFWFPLLMMSVIFYVSVREPTRIIPASFGYALISFLIFMGMLFFSTVVGATAVAYHNEIGSLEESTAVSQGKPT